MWRCCTGLLALALAACVPGVAEYTKTEAPAALRLDGASSALTLSFAPGSARLSAAQALHLDQLVRNGAVRAADRVEIAAAGSQSLAEARVGAISEVLLRYGIVATARPLAGVPPNRAIVAIGRYAVTLPPCPDWSKSGASTDFTNELSSNYGCADATNLGMIVASPSDLAGGRTLGPAFGKPEVAAVERYLNDMVTPLIVPAAVGPIVSGAAAPAPAAGAPSP
jgi:pilus assembly protein CpaD